MQVTEKWPLLARLQFAPRCIFSKSPCIFAKSREIPPGDGFADDWLVSQGVGLKSLRICSFLARRKSRASACATSIAALFMSASAPRFDAVAANAIVGLH